MDFVLPVAVATKAGKKAVITLDGNEGKMKRQLQDKLGIEDTTFSIAHVEVSPDSFLGKAIENVYYYNEESLLDLSSIVEKLNGFDSWQEIYEDISDTSEIDDEFSNKTFFDFDDNGMDEIFAILNRDPMALVKAIYKLPSFNWTDPYLWYSETGYVGTSTENSDLDFSDKGLQKAVLDNWLSEN